MDSAKLYTGPRAWVRAPDLSPLLEAKGEVMIDLGSEDRNSYIAASVGMRFKERAVVRIPLHEKPTPISSPPSKASSADYNSIWSDADMHPIGLRHMKPSRSVAEMKRDFLVFAEERIAFSSSVQVVRTLSDGDSLEGRFIRSFRITVPNVNFPPSFDPTSSNSLSDHYVYANEEHEFEWFVTLHRSDGSKQQIPAGYGAFQPIIPAFRVPPTGKSIIDLAFRSSNSQLLVDKTLPKFTIEADMREREPLTLGQIATVHVNLRQVPMDEHHVALRPHHIRVFYRQRSEQTWSLKRVEDAALTNTAVVKQGLLTTGKQYPYQLSMDTVPNDRTERNRSLFRKFDEPRLGEVDVIATESIGSIWWEGDIHIKIESDRVNTTQKPMSDFHLAYIDIVSSLLFRVSFDTEQEEENAQDAKKADIYEGTEFDEASWGGQTTGTFSEPVKERTKRRKSMIDAEGQMRFVSATVDDVSTPMHYLNPEAPMPILSPAEGQIDEVSLSKDTESVKQEDLSNCRKQVYRCQAPQGGPRNYVGKAWFQNIHRKSQAEAEMS